MCFFMRFSPFYVYILLKSFILTYDIGCQYCYYQNYLGPQMSSHQRRKGPYLTQLCCTLPKVETSLDSFFACVSDGSLLELSTSNILHVHVETSTQGYLALTLQHHTVVHELKKGSRMSPATLGISRDSKLDPPASLPRSAIRHLETLTGRRSILPGPQKYAKSQPNTFQNSPGWWW